MAQGMIAPRIRAELEEGQGYLTFIPWLVLPKEVIVENVAFLPVSMRNVRRLIPGEAGATIALLMRRHRDARGHRLQGLTVLLHRRDNGWTWHTPEDGPADITCKMLALACLSRQTFFNSGQPYMNGAMFTPVVQGCKPGSQHVTRVVQRRTGRLLEGGWQFNDVMFQAAPTIPTDACEAPDLELLRALNAARAAGSRTWDRIETALPFFLLGVSELQELTSHASAMLLALAFERLLNPQKSKAYRLAEAFHDVWGTYFRIKLGDTGFKADAKFAEAQLQEPVYKKWAKELYDTRSSYVHHGAGNGETNWSPFQHVIAASFAFPLTAKLLLAAEGRYSLTDEDDCWCGAFDRLLAEGFVTKDRFKGPEWPRILAEERMGTIRIQRREEIVSLIASLRKSSHSESNGG